MIRLSAVAEAVLNFHRTQGSRPAYANSLIGSTVADEAELLFGYKELIEAKLVEPVEERIGQADSEDGHYNRRTVYRAK